MTTRPPGAQSRENPQELDLYHRLGAMLESLHAGHYVVFAVVLRIRQLAANEEAQILQ